jgi:opacity protein-like surface antigen
MKKLIVTFLFIVFAFSISNGQFTKIGGGLALSSGFPFHNMEWDYNKSGKIAAYAKGIYEISVPLHISPSFTIFYPHITKEEFSKTSVSTMMLDINGHYVFNSLDKFEFYGLAGFNILLAKKKEKYLGQEESSLDPVIERDNALGLNLGVGTYMKITEQFDLSGEAKYIFNNKYNQFMLNVGILINLDWLKKNENTGI